MRITVTQRTNGLARSCRHPATCSLDAATKAASKISGTTRNNFNYQCILFVGKVGLEMYLLKSGRLTRHIYGEKARVD